MTTLDAYRETARIVAQRVLAPEPPAMKHLLTPHYEVILARETDADLIDLRRCIKAGFIRLSGVKRDDVRTVNQFFNVHCNHIEDLLAEFVCP